MAVCVSCEQRKGKRSCPALGGLICPRCCGTKRIVEIRCPPDCRYLSHEKYQGEKMVGESASPHQARYLEASKRGQGVLHVLVLLDVAVASFLKQNPDFPLPAVRDGLRFLRRLASPLQTVEAGGTVFEQHLAASFGPILEHEEIDRDLVAEAAEGTLAFFDEHVEDAEDVREFLRVVEVFSGGVPEPEALHHTHGEEDEDGGEDAGGGGLIVP